MFYLLIKIDRTQIIRKIRISLNLPATSQKFSGILTGLLKVIHVNCGQKSLYVRKSMSLEANVVPYRKVLVGLTL